MSARLTKRDVLSIVEAAYRVDLADAEWLGGIAEACRGALDEGFGICAFEFENRTGMNPVSLQHTMAGMPDRLAEIYPEVFKGMDSRLRSLPFLHGPCVTVSELLGGPDYIDKNELASYFAKEFDIYDSMWITAAEPSGWGCGIHACLRTIRRPSRSVVELWARIAAHLGAGTRLRRRLSKQPARNDGAPSEARFTPQGELEHASGAAAADDTVQYLRQAVLNVEKIRFGNPAPPTRELADWKGLVDARWSLIDSFTAQGRRFVVARDNAPAPAHVSALSLRERQIVGYACLGHTNKVIAYDLGIAHSTVKVLMARAAAKLAVRTREDLIAAFRAQWQAEGASEQTARPDTLEGEGSPHA